MPTITELVQSDDPAAAFEQLADENPGEALRIFESVGGSNKLAEELGYEGKRKRTVARKFRKIIRTPDKDDPVRFKSEVEHDQDEVQHRIKQLLTTKKNRERPFSIAELSEHVDRGPSTVRAALESLREQGYGIHLTEEDSVTIPLVSQCSYDNMEIDLFGDELTFGVISDTHYGSRYAAYGFIEKAYDYFAENGISTVLHPGDMNEGSGELGYKGHANDVMSGCQDWRGQEEFTHKNYPRREGVTTYVISSSKSHCGWDWNHSGRDICKDIIEGRAEVTNKQESSFGWRDVVVIPGLEPREDMVYLGQDKQEVLVGPEKNIRVRLFHPDGGGAYTAGYNLQKFVEAMPGGSKPHIFLVGHYHRFCYIRPRNVCAISCPGAQWESPLFRRLGKEPEVGALVVKVVVDKKGSVRGCMVDNIIHYYEPDGVYAE
jgi:predicted transcriptional regulator